MITLIAEAKTMTACDRPVTVSEWKDHRPAGEETADEVMRQISEIPPRELATVAKFSMAMARKALALAYEFPNKAQGQNAIEAFTGVVFRSFDYSSLSDREKNRADSDIRIISSLYGWLRPDDIIKAYRLDYTTPLAPGDKAMSHYLKKDTTIALVKEIKERAGEPILNLLPGDAGKMIDFKLAKNFASFWKVDFKELVPGGTFRTPSSGLLKEMRGHLLREIILRDISSPAELLSFETDLLHPLGTPDYPDHIAFLIK